MEQIFLTQVKHTMTLRERQFAGCEKGDNPRTDIPLDFMYNPLPVKQPWKIQININIARISFFFKIKPFMSEFILFTLHFYIRKYSSSLCVSSLVPGIDSWNLLLTIHLVGVRTWCSVIVQGLLIWAVYSYCKTENDGATEKVQSDMYWHTNAF